MEYPCRKSALKQSLVIGQMARVFVIDQAIKSTHGETDFCSFHLRL